jgi:hypothetical protein
MAVLPVEKPLFAETTFLLNGRSNIDLVPWAKQMCKIKAAPLFSSVHVTSRKIGTPQEAPIGYLS